MAELEHDSLGQVEVCPSRERLHRYEIADGVLSVSQAGVWPEAQAGVWPVGPAAAQRTIVCVS